MRKKLTTAVSLAAAMLVFGACRKQINNPPSTNSNAPAGAENLIGGGAVQTGDKFLFRGQIANLSIEMTLVRDGERLTGNYFYPRVGKNIALTGTVDKNGNVQLTESDESGKQTGIFKGKWQAAKDSPDPSLIEIEGKWSKPDGSKETDFTLEQQPIAFSGSAHVTPKVIREANKEKRYSVDVEYPQIEGDPRFDAFNREARNLVTKDVAAFKSAESGNEADDTTPPEETQNSTFDAGYDFRYATDNLISVEFTEGTYSRGAAHPNSLTTVLNYDVNSGKRLVLADLFSAKNYLNVISNYCLKELKDSAKKDSESMLSDDMIESGASPRADNYRAWAITRKGLWITFDPYQVAPYAAGPQYVLVPYSALKEIIKPDSPIAALAG